MKINVFLKVDEFFFQKLDLLKVEGVFQKFDDLIANLNEQQQKIIVQVTTFIFIFIPYFAVAFLWWGNFQIRKNIDLKKQIIDQISIFDSNKGAMNNLSSSYLSSTPIETQIDLENKIRNLLSQNSIDTQKVNVTNYNLISSSSNVTKVEADLTFKDFGTSDFSSFMRGMIENDKFKVTKVSLNKNKETNLLEGSLSIIHMGQSLTPPEQ